MNRVVTVVVLAVLAGVALTGVAVGAFSDRATNPQTLTAASPFPGPTPSANLKAQSRTNDGGASGSQIQFGLNLVNTGTTAVNLSTVTLRYWFFNDGGGDSIVSACYYATFGCGNIALGITTVRPSRVKADRYLEVSFPGGSLANGAAATLDQLAIRDQAGGTFTQGSDYSFLNTSSFKDNTTVTVYVAGQLVWGTEPAVAPVTRSLEVKYANLADNAFDQSIQPGLRIENTGSTDIDLTKVTLRYWFTKDSGNGTFQGFCDYAEIGCNLVKTSFGPVTPARTGADSYLQVGFSGGKVEIGDGTGPMQLRFNKSDFSYFDETNDYSHGTNTGYVVWTKVTAYYDGALIWGTEPP